MSTKTSLRRVLIFISGVAVGLFLTSGVASAEPQKDSPSNTSPQPASKADYSGNGANQHGSYDSTRDGSPSGNGNGGGEAKGKPCAGCVGKADNKNPKGQYPDGSDHNKGYECDGNNGIGRSNPAHTGCRMASASPGPVGGSGSSGTTSTVGQPADDSKPAGAPADTVVAGVAVERAASVPSGAADEYVLAANAIRGQRVKTAAVAGASGLADGALLSALPLTGAGVGVFTLALVALALLGTGLVLVRKSRPAVA